MGAVIPAIPDFIVVITTHCRVYDVVFVTVSRQRDSEHDEPWDPADKPGRTVSRQSP